MNKKTLKSVISILLAFVLAISGLSVFSLAAGEITVVTQPTRRNFYEGIEWFYPKDTPNKAALYNGDLDISGTVLSYNGKTYPYRSGPRWPNMFSSPVNGWKAGENEVKIYCEDISYEIYATTTLNFVRVTDISIVSPPNKTNLLVGVDWQLGQYVNDVEFTKYDLTGLVIDAKYEDGTVKRLAATDNTLIGWSVLPDIDAFYPGKNTLLATFCGHTAEFEVNFAMSPVYDLGDVNKDSKITSFDALLTLQHITGAVTLTAEQQTLADVTKDGVINSTDALNILQKVVGNISSF